VDAEGLRGEVLAATNEGSPEAVKIHGGGRRDILQLEVDGAGCFDVSTPIDVCLALTETRMLADSTALTCAQV
jgi:hypothetical protein